MTTTVHLYSADCRQILPFIEDGSVDAVVADPPYNVGCRYNGYDDLRPDSEYESWCREWFFECRRIAKRVVVFPGHKGFIRGIWHRIEKPAGIGCWYKPGNPRGGGAFQWCEWEPWLLYGKDRIGKSDVIRATISRQDGVGNHPCPKPLGLMVELISRLKAKVVLDPFMGTATVGVACLAAGIDFIGIEIDPGYFEIARRRLDQTALSLIDR
jgi:site-specific DNA-methyltransferase (adenine-specific)